MPKKKKYGREERRVFPAAEYEELVRFRYEKNCAEIRGDPDIEPDVKKFFFMIFKAERKFARAVRYACAKGIDHKTVAIGAGELGFLAADWVDILYPYPNILSHAVGHIHRRCAVPRRPKPVMIRPGKPSGKA